METIKELGKFIRWWWRGLSEAARVAIPFITWLSTSVPGLYFFGLGFFKVFFGVFALFMITLLLRILWAGLRKSWNKFQKEQDDERQRIINRLKGEPKHVSNDVDRVKIILDKLRASRAAPY